MEECLVSIFNLPDSVLVVVWRDGYVSTVNNLLPRKEGVHSEGDVVAAVESQPTRTCPDASGAKACSGAVRGAGILNFLVSGRIRKRRNNTYKRRADEGYVKGSVLVFAKALYPWEFSKRGDSRKDGVRGNCG